MSQNDLDEARSEADAILNMREKDVGELFFRAAMRRNLSRTVRHLDQLVGRGGPDRDLGTRALKKLGFDPEA